MRYFALLLALFFAVGVMADNPENWATLEACANENGYQVRVTLFGEAESVMLVPSHDDAFYSSGGVHQISAQNESIATVIFVAGGGSFNGNTLILDTQSPCASNEASLPVIDIQALGNAIAEFLEGLRVP